MSPWDVLGWMIVGVAGMIIAIFLIGILAFVLVSLMEARQKRRWRKRARQRANLVRDEEVTQEVMHNARRQ